MKNTTPTIGLVSGKADPTTMLLCEELAQRGISVIVRSKKTNVSQPNCEQVRQLAGHPGQDLFFNSWKLLF